jgi:hypothetical protein
VVAILMEGSAASLLIVMMRETAAGIGANLAGTGAVLAETGLEMSRRETDFVNAIASSTTMTSDFETRDVIEIATLTMTTIFSETEACVNAIAT